MNEYELTLVLPGHFTEAKKKSAKEKVEKLIKTFKGEVKKLEDWGKIELAYVIKDEESGIYLHYAIELDKANLKSLDEKLRLESDIIRYLLVRK